MDDLRALNERILAQTGAVNGNLRAVVDLLPVCMGKLIAPLEDLVAQGTLKSAQENSLDITSLNKDYLMFARQTARDVLHGFFAGLVILHIDFNQAQTLANLTNKQITSISRHWSGTVFIVAGVAQRMIGPLHTAAMPHYPAAILAGAA